MATSCIVKVGPWGGNARVPWTLKPDHKITGICIGSGDCIDSISLKYTDDYGTQYDSATYGGQGGTKHVIIFYGDEELNQMSGTTGEYMGLTVVKSFSFRTNKRTSPIYGIEEGTSFTLPLDAGKFVGFYGKCGEYINSIGAILEP